MPTEAYVLYLRSLLIAVPLIAGLIRWHKIGRTFHPVIYYCALGVIAESVRFFEIYRFYNHNRPPGNWMYNVFVLGAGILYLWQFANWRLFNRSRQVVFWLGIVFILCWIADHFFITPHGFNTTTRYYRLFYSLVVSLLAIHQMNRLIVSERGSLARSPIFLICAGIILYFVPYIIMESLFIFDAPVSSAFYASIFNLRSIINPVIWLLYTLAILWIPPKKKFIQLS